MNRKIAALSLGFALFGSMAFALTSREVIADLQSQGYTHIEVRVGPTQISVEAIRGTEKLEAVYLSETGAVLRSETSSVGAGDAAGTGVEVRTGGRDFVQVPAPGTGPVNGHDSDETTTADGTSAEDHSSSDPHHEDEAHDGEEQNDHSGDDNGHDSSSDDSSDDSSQDSSDS